MVDNPKKKNAARKVAITIEEKWCKRCGICVALCPQQVFELGDLGRPIPTLLENCRICRMCELYCPDFAVIVEDAEEGNS